MTSRILFNAQEFADGYALKTLREYISKNVSAELFFKDEPSYVNLIINQKYNDRFIDLGVSTLSDICGDNNIDYCRNSLSVDIAVLKNCAIPFSQRKKTELRKRYEIKTSKPVVVIGFADELNPEEFGSKLESIVEVLSNHATVYIIYKSNYSFLRSLDFLKKYDANLVGEFGVLRDYYALADASLDGHNLAKCSGEAMHNFVEATEGGPLFFLEPKNPHQYGYKTLVENSVVKEHKSLDLLLDNLSNYLANFTNNRAHSEKRKEHILKTRATYLPAITAHIKKLLGRRVRIPKTDLIFSNMQDGPHYILHSESNWIDILNDTAE